MSIIHAIQRRSSCRTFSERKIDNSLLNEIEAFCRANNRGPFGHEIRFRLLTGQNQEIPVLRDLNTYGFINGAKTYLAGTVEAEPFAMEDFGFCMERVILHATALNLGTCWLGGTFNRRKTIENLELEKYHVLPAITPIGYPAEKRSITESTVRFFAGSKKRKPWEMLYFFDNWETPLKPSQAGPYFEVLEAVRSGPSASNRQPWRILKTAEPEQYHFYVKRTKGRHKAFPEISLQNVDMGIAMCHFELSARELNFEGCWKVLEQPPQAEEEYIATWLESGVGK